jgi:putative transposase
VREGIKSPSLWDDLKQQVLLSSDEVIEQMQKKIDQTRDLSEVPMAQRRPKPASMKHYEQMAANRNIAIFNAYTGGGYTLKEIGNHCNLHYSTVSGIVRKSQIKDLISKARLFTHQSRSIHVK